MSTNNAIQSTHRDISWFKEQDDNGLLIMRPPYQRNLVWTDRQKSYLIDTILKGYPIPEIYIQDVTEPDGKKKYYIVDGQQRITAFLEFLHGTFPIDIKDSPEFGDFYFEDLGEKERIAVFSYQFVIRLLPTYDDEQLRDIFQRLNRNNVALNMQELRQATYWGPFITTMKRLAEEDYWHRLDLFTTNDIKRMLDVEYISELAILHLAGPQNKKQTIDKFYQAYEREFPEQSKVIEAFREIIGEILATVPEISKTRWVKKTDFYTLFGVIGKHRDAIPLSKEGRQALQARLVEFAGEVDKFVTIEKTDDGDNSTANDAVKEYSLNLRASSDLGARKNRENALDRFLSEVFGRNENQ